MLHLDKLRQRRRHLISLQHGNLPRRRRVEPARHERPDRGEEVGGADHEDPLDGFGVVGCGHAAGGLEEGFQAPEFAEADVGKVDDVGGFRDGGGGGAGKVGAEALGEAGYVFGGEEDGG